MKKTLSLMGVVLVVSLMAVSQAFCAQHVLMYGTATVDGNLSDWGGAKWNAFNYQYDGNPTDIVDGGWTARWTPTAVYMAVKVRDTAHVFKDSYTAWDVRDGVEMYIHTTGTAGDYVQYQETAQEWEVGMKTAANGSVWTSVGNDPAYGVYAPTASQFVAAGSIDGEWLYYEAKMTPFKYFGGRRNLDVDPDVADVVSPLHSNMTIGLDCAAVGNNGVTGTVGYTGMKVSDLEQAGYAGWYGNYNLFSQQLLQYLPGDANGSGTTDATDLNTVLSYYNQSSTDWSKGDFNGDGKTDATDLNTVLSYYNQSYGGSLQAGVTSAVPEPSSIIMLATLSALLGAWVIRRRRG